jgi:chromosome segregation ATPase
MTLEEISESTRPVVRTRLGDGPLAWRTVGGYTPESVRGQHARQIFSKGAVVSMLDAADEEHIRRIRAENERGGEARRVVADVARALDVDIDAGPGHRWDADHMQRVVMEAKQLRVDREGWHRALNDHDAELSKLRDLLRSEKARADAAVAREEAADEVTEQFEAERDEAREQRDAWKAATEALDERTARPLRKELAEERENSAALAAELWATRAALRREPARMVIHTTAAEERDWKSSDLVTADVLAKIGATAPVGSLVDELKNTIVSQAREIARLKGEGE